MTECTIPLIYHGDDARIHRKDKLMVLDVRSALVSGPTIDRYLVLAIVPLKHAVPETMSVVLRRIR
eukprot:2457654-Alexandrium_andersonii.AAC.1